MIKKTLQMLVGVALVFQLGGCVYRDREHDRENHYDHPEQHYDQGHDSGVDVHFHGS